MGQMYIGLILRESESYICKEYLPGCLPGLHCTNLKFFVSLLSISLAVHCVQTD